MAEAPRLHAVAVDGDRLVHEGLGDEVRERAPVVEPHALPERVEDPNDPRLELVDAVVGHGHGLGEALRLVVDAADPDRVDAAEVALGLRVDLGVAVDLARGREEEARPLRLGEAERVVRPHGADLHDLDRQPLEVRGRGGRREVEDVVHRPVHRDVVRHVLVEEREVRLSAQVGYVLDRPREEVVDADHLVTLREEVVAEVAPYEPCAPGDHRAR